MESHIGMSFDVADDTISSELTDRYLTTDRFMPFLSKSWIWSSFPSIVEKLLHDSER
jgi:hypothetical protein